MKWPGCVDRRECIKCGGGFAEAEAQNGTPTSQREAHGISKEIGTGGMNDEAGWTQQSRGKRRMGTLNNQSGNKVAWVGFAGLAQTVVERLLREGERRDEDQESSRLSLSKKLADMRHILGGECAGEDMHEDTMKKALELVIIIEKRIVEAGGATSELRGQVNMARSYLSCKREDRAGRHESEWEALIRSMIACDVTGPDWLGTGEDSQELKERRELTKQLKGPWKALIEEMEQVRMRWKEWSIKEVTRRNNMEKGRETLRLIMRAWREVADGVQAGAAKWDGRWEEAEKNDRGCALGRKLKFKTGGGCDWKTEEGWQTRMVLSYQRLVKAGKVQHNRKKNDAWCDMERKRKQVKAQTGWGMDIMSREEVFKWADESEVQEESQDRKCPITSGAAAALIRKRSREMVENFAKPIYAEIKFHTKKINKIIPKIAATSSSRDLLTIDETTEKQERKPSVRDYRDRSLKYTAKSYKIMVIYLGAGGDRKQETKGIG